VRQQNTLISLEFLADFDKIPLLEKITFKKATLAAPASNHRPFRLHSCAAGFLKRRERWFGCQTLTALVAFLFYGERVPRTIQRSARLQAATAP
jgi:hypothetical protein